MQAWMPRIDTRPVDGVSAVDPMRARWICRRSGPEEPKRLGVSVRSKSCRAQVAANETAGRLAKADKRVTTVLPAAGWP